MSSFGRARLAASLAPALLVACSQSAEPQALSSTLPPGIVARAATELVSSESVARIAQRQGLAPQQALAAATSDALLAAEARRSAPLGIASSIERAASARSLLEQLLRDARRAGPPSQAELDEITNERWTDLARPDAVRTVHAVVKTSKPDQAAGAKAIAEKIAIAVKSAANAEEFVRLANEVPHEGFELRVEPLSPVTADGRTFEKRDAAFLPLPRGAFDVDFARAAAQLTTPGQLSPVTQSAFGFHVIRLEERIPGVTVPKADLPSLLEPEVMTRRAGRARRELLDKLRQGAKIGVDRALDELTAKPKLTP